MHSQRIRQRRRRVTLDQTQSEEMRADSQTGQPSTGESRKQVASSYTQDARRSRQFKTTDLIPKRIWSVTAVIALLFAAIAGLNLLHLNSPDWIDAIGSEGVAALSLDSGRGLGVWYSNFLLLLTACVSLQLYLLRQHRRDDYRGSYRVWMWLALIFLIASAASVTGISTMFRNLVSNLAGSGSVSRGLYWVLLIKLAGLTLLIVRGLIEVRFSRMAVLGLLVVLLTYGTAILINEVPDIQVRSSEYIHAALGNFLLVGCTALFLTVLGYARFVYLEANGLIKVRDESETSERMEARAKKKAAAKEAKAEARKQKEKEKEEKRQQKIDDLPDTKANAESRGKKKTTAKTTANTPRQETTVRKKKKKPERTDSQPASQKSGKTPVSSASSASSASSTASTASTARAEKQKPKRKNPAEDARTGSAPTTGDEYLMSVGEDEIEGLSKSERRRLRKLKRRNERRAA